MKRAPTLTVTAANGVTFLVRLVRLGDPYGREFCLTHDGSDALLEFYDTRYPFWYDYVGPKADAIAANAPVLGQFASRYCLSTLTQGGCRGGLNLDDGVPDWRLDAESMANVLAWAEALPPKVPENFTPGQRVILRCHVRRTKESLGGYYYTLKPGTIVHVVHNDPACHSVAVSDVAEADGRIGEDIFRVSKHMLTPAPELEPSGFQTT